MKIGLRLLVMAIALSLPSFITVSAQAQNKSQKSENAPSPKDQAFDDNFSAQLNNAIDDAMKQASKFLDLAQNELKLSDSSLHVSNSTLEQAKSALQKGAKAAVATAKHLKESGTLDKAKDALSQAAGSLKGIAEEIQQEFEKEMKNQ